MSIFDILSLNLPLSSATVPIFKLGTPICAYAIGLLDLFSITTPIKKSFLL
tara:strand:+ start:1212 stop:1364 length:153 start_codon:yes stop_codon:yes gene_type:complete